jgi:uncharacterized protein (DUF1697 family)/predicted DNA-binding protein (MmcQ/YjbR family)
VAPDIQAARRILRGMRSLVLLLRGINVGTAKQVAMADLKALLEQGGYAGVRTHLRSGNVVVDTREGPDVVARDVEQRIAGHFGFDVDVVVRTADELAATVAADPLADVATNPSRHMVAFLSAEPGTDVIAALQEVQVAPERFAVVGRDVHLWLPDGVVNSPLSKVLTPKRVNATVTVRNWNTVTKLLTMASSSGRPHDVLAYGALGLTDASADCGLRAGRTRMTPDDIRAFCLELLGAVEEFPFAPDVSVFKVGGKMFALSRLSEDPLTVSLKIDPVLGEQLRASYDAVQPGYHLNKRHWVTVTLNADADDELVRGLIEDSHDLVRPRPRRRRAGGG